MSSATVLDSIIEGVRADVAAREAAVSMPEIKAAAEALRDKAGELSGLFATELDHFTRSYVEHAKEQLDDQARIAAIRTREAAEEASDAVAGGFSERAAKIAAEQYQRLTSYIDAERGEAKVYNLLFNNCNDFIAGAADAIGLKVPFLHALPPPLFIELLAEMNT